jgi:glycosyltransferase involved in cell wall biosynthesis
VSTATPAALRAAGAGGVCAIIPALDEAENVGAVVERMPATACGLPVVTLVVYDGSSDGTSEAAAAAGALVARHEANRGGGAALRTGYALAREAGMAIVVTLDADGQHLPEELETLVAPLVEGQAELAVGSRVLGSHEGNAFARELGIALFNRLVSLLTRTRITDCSNSYRAIRVESLARLDLREEQFHASEFLIEALTRGVRTVEVPVTVARRAHGETKKPRSLRYGYEFGRAILTAWARSLGRRGPRSARTPAAAAPAAAERSGG